MLKPDLESSVIPPKTSTQHTTKFLSFKWSNLKKQVKMLLTILNFKSKFWLFEIKILFFLKFVMNMFQTSQKCLILQNIHKKRYILSFILTCAYFVFVPLRLTVWSTYNICPLWRTVSWTKYFINIFLADLEYKI